MSPNRYHNRIDRPRSAPSDPRPPRRSGAARPSQPLGDPGRRSHVPRPAARGNSGRAGAPGSSAPRAARSTAAPRREGPRPSAARSRRPSAAAPQRAASDRTAGGHRALSVAPPRPSLWERLRSSKPAMVALILLIALAALGVWDTASHWQRAYAGVSVNGVDVSGMDRSEMNQALRSAFGPRVSHAQVTVYGSDEDRRITEEALASAGDAGSQGAPVEADHWTTDALSLKANIPYERAIDEALACGREDGGFVKRIQMIADPVDIPLGVDFDLEALDAFASQIDNAIGDPRQDATVQIVKAYAYPIEGHDGRMVDRPWLAGRLSAAMIGDDQPASFVAELTDAPSRISAEQVALLVDQLNHALGCDARFYYKDNQYHATDIDLGDWTVVRTVPDGEGFKLQPSIDGSKATPAIAKGAEAHVTGDDTTVTFERTGDGIIVHTGGEGNLPEIAPAVQQLDDALYGPSGIAWTDQQPYTVQVDIGESDKPETLTLDQAIDSEIVTVVGEFTTEFTNYVGTENRNHNIKLAADILDGAIVKGNGGTWSFNDQSGNTNEEAGFWAAGSIIDGEITDSIGGGICQVATTIFNAVYEAGLDIAERHNHSLYMGNYPDGRDAAVTYPEMDLVWKNTLPSDILLVMSYTDTSVTCKLYSVYTGYTVESQVGEREKGEKYSVRFKEDETYAPGAYVKKSTGEDGSQIMVTRTVKNKDGLTITFDSFQSVYEPKDEIYTVGPGTDTDKLKKELEDERAKKEKAEEEEKAEEDADGEGDGSDDAAGDGR